MKRPGGNVPVVLRGGPFNGRVLRTPELLPEIRFPIQHEFAEIALVERVAKPEMIRTEVAIYRRSGTETTLQLPPPAPPDARRIGYEYTYHRSETG